MKAIYTGVHEPTDDVPFKFIYPLSTNCSLIAASPQLAKDGCPRCAMKGQLYQSCSHGIDSYNCVFAIKNK